jgi:hypothetical protein
MLMSVDQRDPVIRNNNKKLATQQKTKHEKGQNFMGLNASRFQNQ